MDLKDIFSRDISNEDVLRCDLFVKSVFKIEEINIIEEQLANYIKSYVGIDYVWFYRSPLIRFSDHIVKNGEHFTMFELKLRYKDCCEDVWTLISCLHGMEIAMDSNRVETETKCSDSSRMPHVPKFNSNIAIRISDAELILSESNCFPPRWVDTCQDISERLWLMDGTFILVPPSLCNDTDDVLNLLFKSDSKTMELDKLSLKGQSQIKEKISRTNSLLKLSPYLPLESTLIKQDLRIIGRGSVKLPAFIPEGLKDSMPPIGVLIDICTESLAFNDIIDGRFSFNPPFKENWVVSEIPASECVAFTLSKLQWAKLESSKHRLPIAYSSTRWRVPDDWSNPLKAGSAQGLEGDELQKMAKKRESYLNSSIFGGTLCYLYEIYDRKFKETKLNMEYTNKALDLGLSSNISIEENTFAWPYEGSTDLESISEKEVEEFLTKVNNKGQTDFGGPSTDEADMEKLMKALISTSGFEGVDFNKFTDMADGMSSSYEESISDESGEGWRDGLNEIMKMTGRTLREMTKTSETDGDGGLSQRIFEEINDDDVKELLDSAKKEAGAVGMLHSPVDTVMGLLKDVKEKEK